MVSSLICSLRNSGKRSTGVATDWFSILLFMTIIFVFDNLVCAILNNDDAGLLPSVPEFVVKLQLAHSENRH